MASTGGPPPPPRGFEDFSGSNGNSEIDLLHVTTSSSDALLSPQPNLGRMNFLSAKNSVELHKRTIERKHSLPAAFAPEDYARLVPHEGNRNGPRSSLFPPTLTQATMTTTNKKTRSAGKSVGWADLKGQRIPREPLSVEALGNSVQRNESDGRMDIDNISSDEADSGHDGSNVTEEPQLIPAQPSAHMLNMINGAMNAVLLDETINTYTNTNPFEQTSPNRISDSRMRFGNQDTIIDDSQIPKSLFDMNNFGSVGSHESISYRPDNFDHILNPYDGLGLNMNPMDIPRSVSRDPDPEAVTGLTERPGYPNMHTPPLHESSPQQQLQQPMAQEPINYAAYYEDDDDISWPDKPQLFVPSLSTLAVPDPAYCTQNYPPEYHPLISSKFKKDCRTWLWKSSRQRDARLADQKKEEEGGKPN